jgi:hypothetical protein
MAELRRYAEGTTVDVEKSQLEIKRLLTRHGAKAFLFAEAERDGLVVGIVQFQLEGRMVRYERVYPSVKECALDAAGRKRTSAQVDQKREAEWRRRWRALQLIVKAKLEMVHSGDTTFEKEFLADIMLPDGTTVGQAMGPRLAASYESGNMPKMLPGG